MEGLQRGEFLRPNNPQLKRYRLPLHLPVLGWDDTQALGKIRKGYTSTSVENPPTTFRDFSRQLKNQIEEERRIRDSLKRKRNESLKTALTETKAATTKKVFVIAGSRHFTEGTLILEKLNQYPFAVLLPKSNMISTGIGYATYLFRRFFTDSKK